MVIEPVRKLMDKEVKRGNTIGHGAGFERGVADIAKCLSKLATVPNSHPPNKQSGVKWTSSVRERD